MEIGKIFDDFQKKKINIPIIRLLYYLKLNELLTFQEPLSKF